LLQQPTRKVSFSFSLQIQAKSKKMAASLPHRNAAENDFGDRASALTYARSASKASDVLRLQTYAVPHPSSTEVLIQLLAAPVNPQDFLVISNIYPIKPVYNIANEPIPGYDGVGQVLEVGSDVTAIKAGDLVIPRNQGFGTWRTHAVVDAASLAKVPDCHDVRYASILKMTLLPAYFLVEDLCPLKPGDWIVQNAATSSIAQMVPQFAHLKGVRTLSIFRDAGEEQDNQRTRELLMTKGATIALTESEFEQETKILDDKRVALALDCVWGHSTEVMTSRLPPNALVVNYGNLTGSGPTGTISLAHKAVFWQTATFRGWKSTSSLAQRSAKEFDDLTAWVVTLLNRGTIQMPAYRSVAWALGSSSSSQDDLEQKLKEALDESQGNGVRKLKCIFEFRH
jgi:mitochondrial enoyl-[acyl-carrier protein] reductase / trans-2-enoyl-CoA reductase